MQPDLFENADYYDCRDSESLSHETVSEAIEELFDCWAAPDGNMSELIKELSPVTVTAYHRREISDAEWSHVALHAAEAILESLDEEYGDPDDHVERSQEQSLAATLAPVIRDWCKENYQVWQCRSAGKREYTAEQVEAMMRAENPDWFKPSEEAT